MTSNRLNRRRSVPSKPPICISKPPPPVLPPPPPPIPPPAAIALRSWFNWPFTEYYDAVLTTLLSNGAWQWQGPYVPGPVDSYGEINWNKVTGEMTLFQQLKITPTSWKRAMSTPFTIFPASPPNIVTVVGWDWTENMTPDQARAQFPF